MKDFLKVENLSKSYPTTGDKSFITIYENVSFTMEKGELILYNWALGMW